MQSLNFTPRKNRLGTKQHNSNHNDSDDSTSNINTTLSDEIILKVFSFLYAEDILASRQVCLRWKSIGEDST